MPIERILIAVKTYPTLSEKYLELACTAGFRKDGSWIRLYPIPFRLLEKHKRYKKYQWIEVNISKNTSDMRPESYKINDLTNIKLLNIVSTERDWEERRQLILENEKTVIHTDMAKLIYETRKNKLSLAIFKPSSIEGFKIEKDINQWPKDKLLKIKERKKQLRLFKEKEENNIQNLRKLPFKFYYKFKDESGKSRKLMIEDWEIGQLYWNCIKKHNKNIALKKIKEKYFDDFVKKKDLYLFLGTTYKWHVRRARNPYVIIGTFHPTVKNQASLF